MHHSSVLYHLKRFNPSFGYDPYLQGLWDRCEGLAEIALTDGPKALDKITGDRKIALKLDELNQNMGFAVKLLAQTRTELNTVLEQIKTKE